jgi:bla regulator protein BlaR1
MTSALRLAMVWSLVVAGALQATRLSAEAAQSPAADAEKITFEVASVKPNKSNTANQGARMLPGGRIDITNMPLRTMIRMVYGSEAIQTPGQIVGGPSWIGSDRFDIVAKAEGDAGAVDALGRPARLLAMVKALLEERFKVKVHTEMRETQTYALVLSNKDGKPGPKLHESKANCYSPASPPAQGQPLDPARLCGIRGGNGDVTALGATLAQMAQNFANYPVVGRPVKDRTGLPGLYDWHLEFVPAFLNGPNPDSPPIANPAADSGPNLFTAIQEQLGLKLQGEKAQVEYLVIDHAEQPTED